MPDAVMVEAVFLKDVKGLINTALDNGYEPKILANVVRSMKTKACFSKQDCW